VVAGRARTEAIWKADVNCIALICNGKASKTRVSLTPASLRGGFAVSAGVGAVTGAGGGENGAGCEIWGSGGLGAGGVKAGRGGAALDVIAGDRPLAEPHVTMSGAPLDVGARDRVVDHVSSRDPDARVGAAAERHEERKGGHDARVAEMPAEKGEQEAMVDPIQRFR